MRTGETVQMTVVVDNVSHQELIPGEHGLSLLLQSGNQAMLFDAGKTSLVMHNLQALKLDHLPIEWLALSHGHYDHTGGVPALLQRYPQIRLHAQPQVKEPKWILDEGTSWRYGGIPFELARLMAQDDDAVAQGFQELIEGVYASGSVLKDLPGHQTTGRFFRNISGNLIQDDFCDEQVLLVKTSHGLSIVSGCMHVGLWATIQKARVLFPETPFYALIGGLHLRDGSETDFSQVLQQVENAGFAWVLPLHCTGNPFVDYLKKQAPHLYRNGSVGESFEL